MILSFSDIMPDRSHPNVYSPWGRGSGIIRRAICLEADSNVKHEKRIRRRKVESHSKRVAEPTGLESVRHWSVQASDKAEPGRLAAGPGDRWCVVAASADRPHGMKITVAHADDTVSDVWPRPDLS